MAPAPSAALNFRHRCLYMGSTQMFSAAGLVRNARSAWMHVLAACTLPIFIASSSLASEIVVRASDCASDVKLVARGAPLPDVLRKLAQALDFELKLEGTSTAIVNLDVAMPAADLLAKLSTLDNVIVTQVRDARCRTRYRIASVWLLASARGPSRSASPTVNEQPQYDDMSRRAKVAYEEYVRLHGRPPPGEPEEIGSPKSVTNK